MTTGVVTMVGFALPESDMTEILEQDPAMPVQTHAFGWAVVHALRAGGLSVRLRSAAPVSNYPRFRRIVFRSRPFRVKEVTGRSIGFLNVLGAKHLTRFVCCLLDSGRGPTGPGQLHLIHGVHSPFLWFGALSRRLHGTPWVVILTDPPGVVLPADGRITAALKRLDVRLVRAALARCDGVVALAPGLAADFAPGRPALLLEGIVDEAVPLLRDGSAPASRTPRLIYAGGLSRSNGVDRLVDAVDAARTPARLMTYGTGELTEWISTRAAAGDRIERPRLIDRSEVLRSYGSADLLVQPRPVSHAAAAHSFPSKLLEYLASGTPVLSTHLPGIPDEYRPHVYWIEDDSASGMAHALDAVLARPSAERLAFGRAAAEFARRRCGVESQGARLRAFLTDVQASASAEATAMAATRTRRRIRWYSAAG